MAASRLRRCFEYDLDILGAYEKMMQEDHAKMGITDDAMVVENIWECATSKTV